MKSFIVEYKSRKRSRWHGYTELLAQWKLRVLFLGLLGFTMCGGLVASAQTNTAPVRLGIIVADPAAAAVADLLTAELSKKDGLQLVERAEIDRVRREQALSTANKDNLKLGQILGADGLLLLDMAKEGTNQFVTARLIAVKPGVVIGNVRTPWPVPDILQWAKWLPEDFGPLFSKLGVLARDAIPISVVNLHSAFSTSESQEGEQQLTAIVIERLTHERELFVLERRRMELLSDENELKGIENSTFWDGSYLLDGVIDRDGFSKETITINARLTPPKGGAPVAIEVKASRTNLADAATQLAVKVTEALKLNPSAEWNSMDEADEYYDEAQWEFKWGMLKEAQAASESSWALGKRTKETEEFRIKSYEDQIPGRYWQMPDDYPLYSTQMAPAIRSLELYQQGFQELLGGDAKPVKAWEDLASYVLGVAGTVLQRCLEHPDAWKGHEADLSELKEQARATVAMVNSHPAYKDFYVSMASAQLQWGQYWVESPEQYTELCREFVRSNLLYTLRRDFALNRPMGWNPADQAKADASRHQFLQELSSSTNWQVRFEALYFALGEPLYDQQFKERANALLDAAKENAYEIMVEGGGAKNMEDDFRLVFGWSESSQMRREFDQYSDSYEFHTEFNYHALIGYLENDTRFDSVQLGAIDSLPPLPQKDPFSIEQYQKILIDMDAYKARLAQKLMERAFIYHYENFNNEITQLKAVLSPATNAAPSSPSGLVSRRPAHLPAPPLLVGATNAGKEDASNILHVARFWRAPAGPDDEFRGLAAEVHLEAAQYRENRLWFSVLYYIGSLYLQKAFLYGVDPNTFQTEAIELPLDFNQNGSDPFYSTGNSFQVVGDYVYFSHASGIQRFSRLTKKWEDLPFRGTGSIAAVGPRLFVLNKDDIQELNADAKGVTLLASTRRRPAINKLDALGNFANMIPGPNGGLRTMIGGRVFDQAPGTNDWSEMVDARSNNPTSAAIAEFHGGKVITRAGPNAQAIWEWLPESGVTTEPLLAESRYFRDAARARFVGRLPMPMRLEPEPLWKHPRNVPLWNAPMVFDAGDAWFVAGQLGMHQQGSDSPVLDTPDGWHGLVVEFRKDLPEACIVPICLDVAQGLVTPQQLWKITGSLDSGGGSATFGIGNLPLCLTPQGLAVGGAGFPGFWLIPRAELESRVDAGASQQQAATKARQLALENRWQELLKKYHLDHRDHFTPDEKEAMIDDPLFLELDLPEIDVKKSGQLDVGELQFFDANHDGILDSRELTGLQKTWEILASRAMADFDRNGDGILDDSEFLATDLPGDDSKFLFPSNSLALMAKFPNSPDLRLELSDLINLQRLLTMAPISPQQPRTRGLFPPGRGPMIRGGRGQQSTDKELIEAYWKQQTNAAPASATSTNAPKVSP